MTIENNSGAQATELAAALLAADKLQAQERHIQVVTSDLMHALQHAAQIDGVILDIEVVSRLLATIIESNAFGFSPTLDKIARKKFIEPQIKLERQRNQEAWEKLFELEKLELYLRLQPKMSKKYKEKFMLIDVAKETKRIQAMLAEERRREAEGDAQVDGLL